MIPYTENLIAYVLSIGAITAGAAWVLRKLIDEFFSHKIESYKSELERENIKYRITYEKLHIERAEVIKEVYRKIVTTYDAFHDYIKPMRDSGEKPEQEKAKIAGDAFNDFSTYYRQNRIFFNEETATKIDAILGLLLDIANQFHISRILREVEGPSHERTTEWQKAFERLRDEVPVFEKEIQKEFRTLIGIE